MFCKQDQDCLKHHQWPFIINPKSNELNTFMYHYYPKRKSKTIQEGRYLSFQSQFLYMLFYLLEGINKKRSLIKFLVQ